MGWALWSGVIRSARPVGRRGAGAARELTLGLRERWALSIACVLEPREILGVADVRVSKVLSFGNARERGEGGRRGRAARKAVARASPARESAARVAVGAATEEEMVAAVTVTVAEAREAVARAAVARAAVEAAVEAMAGEAI